MSRDESTLVEPPHDDLVGATHARGDEGIAQLLSELATTRGRRRVLVVRALARRDRLPTDAWCAATRDEDVDVRLEALEAYARSERRDVQLLAAARERLADDDDTVVEAAAFALGEHLDVTAVAALCDLARAHRDPRCREAAVAALGSIGDERALDVVIGALDDKPAIRRRAVVAIANFEGPRVEAALERASGDRDWQVRAAVAQLTDGPPN